MKEVFIVEAKRTPVGGIMGSLSSLSAVELGALAIRQTLAAAGLNGADVDSVYMGNVLSGNVGQSPARQAAIHAGVKAEADSTTINKVCASGMKATMIGAQQIQLGIDNVVVTGGMESMSNAPHYVNLRKGVKLGDTAFVDSILRDGLSDAYNGKHMGVAAELCVRTYNISRAQQDEYALSSYAKAVAATKAGKFEREIVPVELKQKSGTVTVTEDEDIYKLIPEKVSKLQPAFEESGTITAANASNLNDAAAALVLASAEAVEKYGLKPLARIVSYADAAQEPDLFTTSPAIAIPKALKSAGLELGNIDFFEINEAYAAVILANQQILGIDPGKVNVYGGAVAIGHPIGVSGARIIATLISVLKQEGGKYGVAAICNGGGGASAIVLESI